MRADDRRLAAAAAAAVMIYVLLFIVCALLPPFGLEFGAANTEKRSADILITLTEGNKSATVQNKLAAAAAQPQAAARPQAAVQPEQLAETTKAIEPPLSAAEQEIESSAESAATTGQGVSILEAAAADTVHASNAATDMPEKTRGTDHAGGNPSNDGQPSALALYLLDTAIERNLSYPAQARKRGVEGKVELEIAVGNSGTLDHCAVATSSGSGILDAAAVRLLKSLFPFKEIIGGAFVTRIAIEYRLN